MILDGADLLDQLDLLSLESTDLATFGLITMDREATVLWYNNWESDNSGLSPDRVVGRHFFNDVAQCLNNHLVAERFVEEPDLVSQLDWVFTLRMRPTPVRLRMMARADSPRQYLGVQWR